MKNNTKFNWKCPHCQKRNIVMYKFQFDVPKIYTGEVKCDKCGTKSKIEFSFLVTLK